MAEKKVDTLKESPETISDEVARYGLSKRRFEFTRCDRCLGKVRVSAGIMLRIARAESFVLCGKCLGIPGSPEERSYSDEQQQG